MQIQFGETVRRLRLARGLTQEQLAQRLGFSFQAISKWERDESYPDITMLPVLAAFFGVKTDDLLGLNEAENERRVQEILDAYDSHKPDTAQEHLPVLKSAIEENPLDYRLMVRYMECRLYCAHGLAGGQEAAKETRELYENIDQNCTNDRIRMWAKRLFVMHLHSLGEQEEAERILHEMPDLRACREHVATMVSLPGEDHLRAVQSEIASLIWMVNHAICHHDIYGKAHPGEEASFAYAREILDAMDLELRLLALFYPDGDYGKNSFTVIYDYGHQAFYRAVLGAFDEAFAAMRRCMEQARAFDGMPRVTVHTSPLFRGLAYDKIAADRGMAARMRELFGERYPWPAGFREDARFAEILGGKFP